MIFRVEGYESTIEHISLNQIGIFCFKLKPIQSGKPKRHEAYCATRLVRNRDETEIHFESNAVIHNSMSFPIRLRAFSQVKR